MRQEFSRTIRTVAPMDHEIRLKLSEQSVFEHIAQAIAIGVGARSRWSFLRNQTHRQQAEQGRAEQTAHTS
jgi:hypothetical protein